MQARTRRNKQSQLGAFALLLACLSATPGPCSFQSAAADSTGLEEPFVVQVNSSALFRSAVLAGVAHIEITDHLDLRPLPDDYEAGFGGNILEPLTTLQTITVGCYIFCMLARVPCATSWHV
jgi:hypothetical protein